AHGRAGPAARRRTRAGGLGSRRDRAPCARRRRLAAGPIRRRPWSRRAAAHAGRPPPGRAGGAAMRLRRSLSAQAESAQLALVVEILAAHVRAGRSLSQALVDAVEDAPAPTHARVGAAAAAAGLGTPVADALGMLGEGADVAYLAAAVRLQTRAGGDLALLLERIAELL